MEFGHEAFINASVDVAPEERVKPVVIDYPKSEPVLESSYVFPKVESYGIWRFTAPGTFAVPANR